MSEDMKREPRKQCSQCEDYKLLEEFFVEKKKPMGRQSRCKLCHKAGVKAWRALRKAGPVEVEALSGEEQ